MTLSYAAVSQESPAEHHTTKAPIRGAVEIALRSVSRRYGATTAVDDVTARIPAGGVTALLGPNGAGKTTLVRLILGLTRPTDGTITFLRDGEVCEHRPSIGFSLDGTGLDPALTVRQQLRVVAAQLGGAVGGSVEEILEDFGLTAFAAQRVKALSTGQRQRLGLAVALAGAPDVLILDEPSNGLSPEAAAEFHDRLQHRRPGVTVLLVSHGLGEVAQLADHLVVLRRRVLHQGPLAPLVAEHRTLEAAYAAVVGAA